MARKRMNNTGIWSPSTEELTVIEYLAAGYSQNRTAKITGIPQSTIASWFSRNPAFAQMVADRTVEFVRNRDATFAQTLALAQMLVHQGLTGELSDDDPALRLAIRVVERFGGAHQEHRQFGAKPRELPPGVA